MPLETATYINQLVAANPAATDSEAQGANHLRLIKAVLQAQFPNFSAAALNSTNAQIDQAVSAALAGTFELGAGTVGAPALALAADTDTGVYSTGVGKIDVAVEGAQALEINATGLAVNNQVSCASLLVAGSAPSFIPTGGTLVWWTAAAPSGFLFCNGQAVSRTIYSSLFTLLGTTYGAGDGSTTFNLPDLREATPIGGDMGAGTNSRSSGSSFSVASLGAYIGEWLHTLVTGEMPAHSHAVTINDPGHFHDASQSNQNLNITGGGGGFAPVDDSTYNAGHTQIPTNVKTTGITASEASQGGGSSHNNLGPSVVCNWIIKT